MKTVKGVDEARVPQSFACDNGKYIISYIYKDTQRVIVYGDGKTVYEPETDLGHANGFTIVDGLCYSVRGGGDTKVITFDTSNKNYGSFELAYGASGIAYDETSDMIYTSSRGDLTAYDRKFNVINKTGRVIRTRPFYVQDCGAYGGILMHCISGEDYKGINYIDFYDMINSRYLGSVECDLSEIESLIVDEEGYIELLCNTSEREDYIWKTPLNMKTLCEE